MYRKFLKKGLYLGGCFVLFLSVSLVYGFHGVSVSVSSDTSIEASNVLQMMIDAAAAGQTISVPVGCYSRPVVIDKPLTLKGQGNATRLIVRSERNKYALHIAASDVRVQGLLVENHGPGLYATGIKITATRCVITDCTVQNTPVGIAVWADDAVIQHCYFYKCRDEGIALLGSANNPCYNVSIKQCSFIQNCDGIELQQSRYTLIEGCRFVENTHAGVDAIGEKNTYIRMQQCVLERNSVFDVYLAHAENTTISESIYDAGKIMEYHCSDTVLQVVNASLSSVGVARVDTALVATRFSRFIDYVRTRLEEIRLFIYSIRQRLLDKI